MTLDRAALPRNEIPEQSRLYRIHRAVREGWFFDASAHGRFNPVSVDGRGSSYWAETPVGAFIEAFRTPTTINEDDIRERRLSTITLARPLIVVDLTQRAARAVGVTAALTAGADYSPAQHLASELHDQVDGIRYRARHDLAAQITCLAIFGSAEARPDADMIATASITTEAIGAELVGDAERNFGYRCIPRPR